MPPLHEQGKPWQGQSTGLYLTSLCDNGTSGKLGLQTVSSCIIQAPQVF